LESHSLNEANTVSEKAMVVVVGLGEIGKPLLQLISRHHDVLGVDISPVERVHPVDVMHICFPFQVPDFVGEAARYIEYFQPALTIINSTVGVGTTRAIAERTGAAVVNSPVRGKHARMLDDLQYYTKFVGGMDASSAERAAAHFQSLGLKTKTLPSPEATELAKLTETTYFGLMIAWAQEVERYSDQIGQNYEDVVAFYDEIKFFPPVKYFPGIIGGHCVLPNIEILSKMFDSALLKSIQTSNQAKIQREADKPAAEPEKASEATKAL
jgi:UDP-N-acetyl-D-mannosaminuronate dehydrogenase